MLADLSLSQLAVVLASIVISLSFHEAMHGFVAHWLGDTTAHDMGRLTLNPLKHIDLVTTVLLPMILILSGLPPFFAAKPVPFNPARVKYEEYGAALIGVAGPLTNLLLACLAAVVYRVWATHLGPAFSSDIVIFVEVNIGFFIFNMIPFPPLDGSRLLYAFAPEALQRVMYQIESAGFLAIIVIVIIVFQFLSGPIAGIENHLLNFLLG